MLKILVTIVMFLIKINHVCSTMVGYNWQCLRWKGQYLSMELIIFLSESIPTPFSSPLLISWRQTNHLWLLFKLKRQKTTVKMREMIRKPFRGVFVLGNAMRSSEELIWGGATPGKRHQPPPPPFFISPSTSLGQRHNNPEKWMKGVMAPENEWIHHSS